MGKSSNQFERMPPGRWPEALRVFVSQPGMEPDDIEHRLADLMQLHEHGGMPLDGVWSVVDGQQRILATLVVVLHPGRTASLVMPTLLPDRNVATELATRACQWAAENGVVYAQCLLDGSQRFEAALLKRIGFSRLTRMLMMQAETRPPRQSATSLPFDVIEYQPALRQRFADTIKQTYEGSQDCPELDDMRAMDDVIVAHQAEGHFDPALWYLFQRDSRDVACLLLNESPAEDALQINYVGVVPNARGHGYTRRILPLAHNAARARGLKRLCLSVSEKNRVARRIYRAEGFVVTHRKTVYLMCPDIVDSYRQSTH